MLEHPFGDALTATVNAEVQDPEGIQPATIIQTEDAWLIHVEWEISGPAAPFVGGNWHVAAYLESIGGDGFEGQVGDTVDVPLSDADPAPARSYTADINVLGDTVPAGAYKLVTLINYTHLDVPCEMAAFTEGPILQFYVHDV
jgi:hypothetical protein